MKTRGWFTLIITVCTLLFCSKSYAGWTIEYEDGGSEATGSRFAANNTKSFTGSSALVMANASIYEHEELSFTVKAKLKVKVYAVWNTDSDELENNPNASTLPVPKKLLVKETCSASAGSGGKFEGHVSGSAGISLPFGQVTPVRNLPSPEAGQSQQSTTTQWTTVDNSAGNVRVLVGERTITADGNISSDTRGMGARTDASAMYIGVAYSYPEIVSPQIEPSFYKAADGTRQMHINDDPSDKKVTSGVEWFYTSWVASREYYAQSSPFQYSQYSWAKQGDGSLLQNNFDTNGSYVFGTLNFGDADQTLNKKSKIKVYLTDYYDLATPYLASTCEIEWKLPYEDWAQRGPRRLDWERPAIKRQTPAEGCVQYASVTGYYDVGDPMIGVAGDTINTADDLINNRLDFIEKPVGWYLKAIVIAAQLAFKAQDPDRYYHEESVTLPWSWGNPQATYSPDKYDDKQEFYRMFAGIEHQYETSVWKGSEYNSHGYVGPVGRIIKKETGAARAFPKFVYQLGTGGDPGPGDGQDENLPRRGIQ